MATIEEKIEELANKILPCNTFCRYECSINFKDCMLYKDICDALTKIAEYQKEIDEEVRLKKSDDMTQAEYDRELAFAAWYYESGNGTPTFSDAIEWARSEAIDKACKWLSYYFVIKNEGMSAQGCDAFLKEFRKAMEE